MLDEAERRMRKFLEEQEQKRRALMMFMVRGGMMGGGGGGDTTVPVVTEFAATTPSTSLTISITACLATDDVGVAGYKITENNTPPLAGAAGWSAVPLTEYVVSASGNYSLYLWAKDLAGNVSAEFAPAAVVVDAIAPTVVITLSDYAIVTGDTPTLTATFSESPVGFTASNVISPNGSLSAFGVTGNPLVYTAVFTPTVGVNDATNVITVDVNWADAAGNPPAGETVSDNYTVDTAPANLILNGDFATNSDWNWGAAGLEITGGKLVATDVSGFCKAIVPPLTADVTYRITADVTRAAGAFVVTAGATGESDVISSTGAIDINMTPNYDGAFGFYFYGFTGTIDNVSAVEI